MTGILPTIENGAVVVRNTDGSCTQLGAQVKYAYCPPATFLTTCRVTALPDDCVGRITPPQMNAVVSELLCLAEALSPDGTWDCESTCNLGTMFSSWWNGARPLSDGITIDGDGTPGNEFRVLPEGTVAVICQDPEARSALAGCLIASPAAEPSNLITQSPGDGGLMSILYVTPGGGLSGSGTEDDPLTFTAPPPGDIVDAICNDDLAHDALAGCLISTDADNLLVNGSDGGLFANAASADDIATSICASPTARETLSGCLVSADADNIIATGTDGLLYSDGPSPQQVVSGICSDNAAHDALADCLISSDPDNIIGLGSDGGIMAVSTAIPSPQQIVASICADDTAHDNLASCLRSTQNPNIIGLGTDGGLRVGPQEVASSICSDGTARNTLSACLISTQTPNVLVTGSDGRLRVPTTAQPPVDTVSGICGNATARNNLTNCLIAPARADLGPNGIFNSAGGLFARGWYDYISGDIVFANGGIYTFVTPVYAMHSVQVWFRAINANNGFTVGEIIQPYIKSGSTPYGFELVQQQDATGQPNQVDVQIAQNGVGAGIKFTGIFFSLNPNDWRMFIRVISR